MVIPVAAIYIAHFTAPLPGMSPTGFIVIDAPFYAGIAREYVEDGHAHLRISNPFNPDYNAPKIFSQPQFLLLGMFTRFTGLAPGIALMVLHLLLAVLFFRVVIVLYEVILGPARGRGWLTLLCFCYGGGVLTIAGLGVGLVKGESMWHAVTHIFRLDPINGWCCLNLGRNAINPFENLYHILFFGVIILTILQRYKTALLLGLLLAMCHPFSSIELILIMLTWSFLERVFWINKQTPLYFISGWAVLLAGFIIYYGFFLNSFPEHKITTQQMAVPWLLDAKTFIPAYCIVAAMILWRIRNYRVLWEVLGERTNRMLFVWALVAFAIANHEFAIKPFQPLHFTRGYIWTPLFLLGGQSMCALFVRVSSGGNKMSRVLSVSLICLVMMFDNISWFGALGINRHSGEKLYHMSQAQAGVIDYLAQQEGEVKDTVVVSDESFIALYVSAYTHFRNWYSNWHLTPNYENNINDVTRYLVNNEVPARWRGSTILLVVALNKRPKSVPGAEEEVLFLNDSYEIVKIHFSK